MKNLIASVSILVIPFTGQANANEMVKINVNRVCAAIVGIPYASDDFGDNEWNKFQSCVKFIRSYDRIK